MKTEIADMGLIIQFNFMFIVKFCRYLMNDFFISRIAKTLHNFFGSEVDVQDEEKCVQFIKKQKCHG